MRTVHLAALAALLLALLAAPLLPGAQMAEAQPAGVAQATGQPAGYPEPEATQQGAPGLSRRYDDPAPSSSGSGIASVVMLLVILPFALFVLYYVFMIRTVIHALRDGANGVLLVFAFLSLLPTPFTWVLGVCVMIVWRSHRRDLAARRGAQ